MDQKLTDRIKQWLDATEGARDLNAANLMLLQLSGNRVAYRMIARNPAAYEQHLQYQLQKYYDFRVKSLTHSQVEDMQKKVDKIVEQDLSLSVKADESKRGLRPDHESLPEEIQQLVDENTEIIVKMRRLHKTLSELSLNNAPCPDSERYPFLKELIKLDKKLHTNWKKYDQYTPNS